MEKGQQNEENKRKIKQKKMNKIKYKDFKKRVCCKLNEDNSCTMNENFGVLIKKNTLKDIDLVKEFIEEEMSLSHGIMYQHCCRSNGDEIMISGMAELSPPEIKDKNKDGITVGREYVVSEFESLESKISEEFPDLEFEVLILDPYENHEVDFIKY